MKGICSAGLTVFLLMVFAISPAAAEKKQAGQVFDLGDVLVMEKGDEINPVTTTNVISVEDLEKQGARTAADALDLVPGLDVQLGGKGQADLNVRGFDQFSVKVLIDGVPAHAAYDGFLDLSQIPVESIAKIKVIKGASSVLYGPNTLGGVINIITKKGGEKPYTSVTTSFGDNDTRNYITNHGASIGKFNYWVTASRRTSDGFDVSDRFDPTNPRTGTSSEYNEDGGVRDLSYYTFNTLHTKLGYEYDTNSKIYFSFDYHDNEKGIPTEGFGRNNNPRYWEFDEWKQWHANLVGEHNFTDLLTMKARVYYVSHEDTIKDVSWDDAHTTVGRWFDESSYDDYTVGGEIQGYLDFGDISLVRLGASFMRDNHTQQDYNIGSGFDPEEEYETDTYSFAVEDEVKLGRLILTAGVSYDVHDPVKAHGDVSRDKEETINPQAGAAFNVTEDFRVYASVGRKTRFPQMKELYSDIAGGNKSLKPQKTIAYEVGAGKKFMDMAELSVAAFFNDVEDRIVRNSSREFENVGESDIKGLETQLNVKTPWNFDFLFGYTYINGREKESAAAVETDIEYLPEHKAFLDARYYFDFGLTCALQTIYTGEQVEYNSGVEHTFDDFVIVNGRLNQEIAIFKKLTADLFVEVKNIFDENYEEGSGPTPGRSFLAGVTLSF